jgi:hypothetical protein
MKPRLVIITEIIAPYRVPVFNSLAAQAQVDLHVLFLAETDPRLRQWTIPKDEIRFSYDVLPSFRLRLGNLNLLLNRGLDKALRHSGRGRETFRFCCGRRATLAIIEGEARWWSI